MKTLGTRLSKLEQRIVDGQEPPMVVLLRIVAPGCLSSCYGIITDWEGREWRRRKTEPSDVFLARVESEVERITPPGKVAILTATWADKTGGDQ